MPRAIPARTSRVAAKAKASYRGLKYVLMAANLLTSIGGRKS